MMSSMTTKLNIRATTKECDVCKDTLKVFDFGDRSMAFDSQGLHQCLDVPSGAELLVIED